MKTMKKKIAVMMFVLPLLSSGLSYAGCMAKYMDVLQDCYALRWEDRQVCEIDGTLEYLGCIRKTLLF